VAACRESNRRIRKLYHLSYRPPTQSAWRAFSPTVWVAASVDPLPPASAGPSFELRFGERANVPGPPRRDQQPGGEHLGAPLFGAARDALVFGTLLPAQEGDVSVHRVLLRWR
jgi:hypothetical protein